MPGIDRVSVEVLVTSLRAAGLPGLVSDFECTGRSEDDYVMLMLRAEDLERLIELLNVNPIIRLAAAHAGRVERKS